jgi:hypothetical protein
VVAGIKIAMYPVDLIPKFMSETSIKEYDTSSTFTISVAADGQKPKVSQKVLVENLNKIVAAGDPSFDMVIEFGKKQFGWLQQGILLNIPNLKLSQILSSAETGDWVDVVGKKPQMANDIVLNIESGDNLIGENIKAIENKQSPKEKRDSLEKYGLASRLANILPPSQFNNKELTLDDKTAILMSLGFTAEQASVSLTAADGNLEIAEKMLNDNIKNQPNAPLSDSADAQYL